MPSSSRGRSSPISSVFSRKSPRRVEAIVRGLAPATPSVARCSPPIARAGFIPAEAGLLDKSVATTHWAHGKDLCEPLSGGRFACLRDVDQQNRILCSGAVTTSLNLAIRLVEEFAGAEIAMATAKMMLIDTNRVSQSSYASLPEARGALRQTGGARAALVEKSPSSAGLQSRQARAPPRRQRAHPQPALQASAGRSTAALSAVAARRCRQAPPQSRKG